MLSVVVLSIVAGPCRFPPPQTSVSTEREVCTQTWQVGASDPVRLKLQERLRHVQLQRACASGGGLLPELLAAEELALPASAAEDAHDDMLADLAAGASAAPAAAKRAPRQASQHVSAAFEAAALDEVLLSVGARILHVMLPMQLIMWSRGYVRPFFGPCHSNSASAFLFRPRH